ncbi:MAG: NifB/NifX family molybdenum-iron cluster-binding protein [Bacillota bacterium]|nr:NifB/NifX family molybdenum-iron cluster-binding protein [Bacillota bacterium]
MPATESSAPDNVAVVGVPADGQLVAEHFSRASFFVLAKVSPGRVRDVRIVAFPARGKGSPAIFLAGLGVNLVLACEIGERAARALKERGIEIQTGVTGPIELALRGVANPGPAES